MDVTSERGKKCIPTGEEQPQKPNKMNGIGSRQETTTSERRRRREKKNSIQYSQEKRNEKRK